MMKSGVNGVTEKLQDNGTRLSKDQKKLTLVDSQGKEVSIYIDSNGFIKAGCERTGTHISREKGN